MLMGSLTLVCGGGVACAVIGGLPAAALLSMLVGGTSSSAKQAFDAIVQRDAPDANRGRSFARFETRFQLFWVIGAIIPVVVSIPAELGYVVVAGVAGFAIVSYVLGMSQVRSGRPPRPRATPRFAWLPGRKPSPPPPPRPSGGSVPADAPPPPSPTDPTTTLPPPPTPSGSHAAGTSTPTGPTDETVAGWEPPPGFVSRRLVDETSSLPAPSPPPPPPPPPPASEPQPAGATQEPLPFGGLDVDAETGPQRAEDYPEPPWRDDAPGS
jgi:hypothetical protein